MSYLTKQWRKMWKKPVETPKQKRLRIVTSVLWSTLIIWAIIPGSTVIYKAEAEAPQVQEVKLETKEQMVEYINKVAAENGLSAQRMIDIISCENITWEPTRQSGLVYKKDNPKWGVKKGEREQSYGLVQIHVVDHPVTVSQAKDAKFSIDYMAKLMKEQGTQPWIGSKYCWSK